MMRVNSQVKINTARVQQLTQAAVTSLEQTAEALHTEVVQAQVVPRDTGRLQGEAFFLDRTESRNGKVSLVHSTPYARKLYFHPEYKFKKTETYECEKESGWMIGCREEKRKHLPETHSKIYIGGMPDYDHTG